MLLQLECASQLPADLIKRAQPQQGGEQLARFPELSTQRQRPGIGRLHFRGRVPLGGHPGRTERDLEREFLSCALGRVGQGPEQGQRRAQVRDRLGIGRALHRLAPGAVQVLHRLRYVAAAAEMMRQLVAVFFEPGAEQRLDRLGGAFMQCTAPLAQQRAVGHLLGQPMLEAVLHFRKRRLLVDELPGLQPRQQALQRIFGQQGDARQQAPRKCLADHRQGLQQRLLGRLQAVDAGGDHPLHGGRDVQRGRDLLEPVMPALAAQHLFLDQRLHHFFDEERVAFGLRQDQLLEWGQPGGVAQQVPQQFPGFGLPSGASRSWV